MKQNNGHWSLNSPVSILPKRFVLCLLLAVVTSIGSATAQTSSTGNNISSYPIARMTLNNLVVLRGQVHTAYQIPMNHFQFSSVTEAQAYFDARDVNYIDFVVQDVNTVVMQFDTNNASVQGWTIADWNAVIQTRSSNSAPRQISNL